MNRLVPGLAAAILLYGSACMHSSQYYAEKGNKLLAEGKFAEAALNYRKAVQKDGGNGDAYYQLGLAELRLEHLTEAYQNLLRAAALLPNRSDVQVKVADLCLSAYLADSRRPQRLYERVASLSDLLLTQNPNSVDGQRLKGFLALADGQPGVAGAHFQKALMTKPMDRDVVLGLTQALIRDNQAQAGEKLAIDFISKDPTFGATYDVLHEYYLFAQRPVDAERILQKKVNNNPTEASYMLQLATYYASGRRGSEMTATLQRLLDNPKNFPQAHLQVGDFYTSQQNWDAAVGQYEEGAHASPKERIVYLKKIVEVRLAQGKGEEASQAVVEILKEQPKDEAARGVRASLLLAGGKPEKLSEAVSEFQDLVKKNPDNAIWHFNLGRAFAAKGDLDGAREQFQEAVGKRNDFVPPRIALAELSRARGDYRATLQYANEILKVNPTLSAIRLLRAFSLMNTGKEAEAQPELIKLEKELPENQEIQLQLAVLELKQKKFDAAKGRFQRLTEQNPGNSRVMNGLVQTYGAQSQLDKALQLLQEELKKSPNSDVVRYMVASTAVQLRKYDLAIDQCKRLTVMYPKSVQLTLLLATACRLKGDVASAIANYQKAGVMAPNDPIVVADLAEAFVLSGQKPKAIATYRRALQLKPDNWTAMNNLAFLIVENGGSLDEALKLAQTAVEKAPRRPEFTDTLGWIYIKKNLNDSAIQVFRGLTRQNPENPSFRYHLGMALLQKGDRATAKAELQNALSLSPPAEVRQDIEAALAKIG